MAASTSTTISNTSNTTATSTPATQAGSNGLPAGQKMPASEVGWCFVHEYYTFLNKDPSRLHCFYGQKSTLIHGTEGETVTPSQGEKEIKEKFQGLNLENCRVLITNVDSQASINGGILIQVLGEISNRNEVARRFAQTFFLDVQPNVTNGYYVLNDIIRFLSDDDIEIYNGEEEAGASTSPTGTLVEEPINARVEAAISSSSAQNTESAQVALRTMDTNTAVPSSKENEAPSQTVSEVVDPFVDNDRVHTLSPPVSASIVLHTNVQYSVQNEPPLSTMPNYNERVVDANKQDPAATLIANIQQSPASEKIEDQSLLKSSQSLQGNNRQALKPTEFNVVASPGVSTSRSVEEDKHGQLAINSKQVPEQPPPVDVSQGVGQTLSTQRNIASLTSSPVMRQPANIPKQIPAQAANITAQSHINNQSPISTFNASQARTNDLPPPTSAKDNDLSSSKQKLSFEDNGQTTNISTGSQLNGQGTKPTSRPESPSNADKKKNVQNVPKDGVSTSTNGPEIRDGKLSYNNTNNTPAKKTWASLAANEPEKWSSNALSETKGVVASVPKPISQAQSQQMRDNRDRRSEGQKINNRRNSDTSLSIYVKGVTPSMTYELLKAAFSTFGHVKHLDVVHTKSCAFVEYNNTESYRRALEAHTVDVGSEILPAVANNFARLGMNTENLF
ncbi:ubiquitin protease cofactor [Rhizophagus clarus]|uniref:Ubiquitin protease cofactor n=1 Tax=Rhizophagus clarus TaxID=94130 RepID=A0A8H3LNL2_9GLOM|nr:ubiquitin protease cofactor [Rhizophagus clarus]